MTDSLLAALGGTLDETYAIESELAGGGMSRVFVARERALERRVVIKVLADAGHAVDPRRFRQEILLSASLQHPHIVPVHTAGEVSGVPYFVMPFVEGVSLRARLRDGGRFAVAEAIRVLRDVATALHYAHTRGIVHRDLKPENVMISGGSAVVLDFGVAKAMQRASAARSDRPDSEQPPHDSPAANHASLTALGITVGTPRYMAPEQAAGDPNLDHRADVYAFGVLAFELLTGDAPFTGSPSEVLRKHLVEPPPDVATLRAGLPATLVDLVAACLAKDPAQRPASAAVLLDALDGLGTPLTGTKTAAVARPRPRGQGRWSEALAVPAVYLLAAGGALAMLFRLAAQERVREGIVAAAVIGSLLGLPIAVAGGLLVRVMARERVR
jgi:serine/threonine-protein kinase